MTHLIKSTTDYNKFRKLNGNRPVRPNHVKRIVESMQKQLLPTFIEVNEHYEIIDGQHRIEALKELELPVGFKGIPQVSASLGNMGLIYLNSVVDNFWIYIPELDWSSRYRNGD